jgi:hypothetical protein
MRKIFCYTLKKALEKYTVIFVRLSSPESKSELATVLPEPDIYLNTKVGWRQCCQRQTFT